MHRFVFTLLASAFLLLPGVGLAGSGAWTGQGPFDGGAMGAVVADPTTPDRYYASSGASLFRSDDGGLTWIPINTGLTETTYSSRALVPHPTLGGVVYVGGVTSVWKTTDAGANWNLSITGLPAESTGLPLADRRLYDLHTVPSMPNRVYAATASGLYVSTDAGATWSGTGYTAVALDVSVDPANVNNIILQGLDPVTQEYRLYRSTNGGTSWSSLDALLPAPHAPGSFIAGVRHIDFSGTVIMVGDHGRYRSTDSGGTWTLDTAIPYSSQTEIRVDPTNSMRLMIASTLEISTDGGMTWTGASTRPRGLQDRQVTVSDAVFNPFNPNQRLAATQAGLYKQTAAGMAWTRNSAGLDAYNIRALAVNPDNPDHVVVAGSESDQYSPLLYRSDDGGATWSPSNAGLTAGILRALEMDPNTTATPLASHVYAAGWNLFPETDSAGNPVPSDGGVYKSTDGGQNWSVIDNGLPVMPSDQFQLDLRTFRDIELRPDSGSTGGSGPLQTVFIAGSGVFQDDGSGGVDQRSARIYRSTDAGGTWSASETGIPAPSTPDGHFPAGVQLIIDPSNNDVMYFSTFLAGNSIIMTTPTIDNGVFKSIDGGSTWTHASNGLPRRDAGTPGSSHLDVLSLALDPSAPMTLYASVNDISEQETDLYKTTDGAATWTQLSGLPSDIGDIRDIQVDSTGTVYLANAQSFNSPGAIWASTDGGTTWNSISVGLSPRAISTKLLIDENRTPTRIYAGTRRSVQAFDVVGDMDGDGVPDALESAGPGAGDGNGDGTQDSAQSHVASFQGNALGRGAGAGYITVEVTPLSGDCTLLNDAESPGADELPDDTGRSYPWGLARFDIANCDMAQVRMIIHQASGLDDGPFAVRNFGPEEPGTSLFVWYDFTAGATFGDNEVTFTLTDGGFGDIREDDGRILYQGGVSTLAETFFTDGFELN